MAKLKRIIISLGIFIFILVLMLFFYSFFKIYLDVKSACLRTQSEYVKDCVDSLIEYIQSDKNTFKNRNSAVWALGQLADKKALPFLYELDKSLPQQEKCKYENSLCKYEVQKAIKWCENGNITSWMYRIQDNWHI